MIKNNFGLKEFYWFYLITFILTPVGFLIRIFYSKTLSVEEFAYIYGIINLFNLVFVLSNLGLSASLGYYIPKFLVNNNQQRVRNSLFYVLLFYLMMLGIFTIIIYLFRYFITINYFNDERIIPFFTIMLIFFVGNSLFTVLKNIYVSFKMNVYSQGMTLIKFLSILILSVLIFLIWGESSQLGLYFAYVWALGSILALIFYTVIFFVKNSWVIGKLSWDFELVRMLFSTGFYLFISGIGVILMAYIDVFLITTILGVLDAGIYDTMISLIRLLPLFLSAIAAVFIPLFSELKSKGNYDLINRHLNMLYGFGIFIMAPIALSILIFSNSIIRFLYSPEFLLGAGVLKIFAALGVFRVMSDFNRSIMNGLGLSKSLILITFFVVGINFFFDLLLIPLIGITGAGLVTAFGWVIYVVLTTFHISNNVKLKFDFKKLGLIFLDSTIFLVTIAILKYFIQTGSIFIDGILVLGPGLILYVVVGNYLKVITFNEILLFVPSGLRPKFVNIKSKYFNYIK